MKLLSRIVESFFFRTDKLPYWHASHFKLNVKSLLVADSLGNRIAGQLLFGQESHSTVILHCHAGIANMHLHLPQIAFLAQAGYPVITFDYEGCGISEGTLCLDRLGAAAQCIANWVIQQSHLKNVEFIVFGQGLGADAALQFYNHNKDRTKAVILESVYLNRKNWLKQHYGPLLGDLMAMLLKVQAPEPGEIIKQIQVPTFVAYPANDTWTKPHNKNSVLATLSPSAELFEFPKTEFLTIFTDPSGQNQRKLLHWLKHNGL